MPKHKLGTRVEIVGKHWKGRQALIVRNHKHLGFDYQVQLDDGTTIGKMADDLKVIGKGDGDDNGQNRQA